MDATRKEEIVLLKSTDLLLVYEEYRAEEKRRLGTSAVSCHKKNYVLEFLPKDWEQKKPLSHSTMK